LNLSIDEIMSLVDRMENETRALKQELFKMCWYMRGGLTMTEAYQLDNTDREIIGNLIRENLEITKESGMPFF